MKKQNQIVQAMKCCLTKGKFALLLFISILIFSNCNNIKSKNDFDWSGNYSLTHPPDGFDSPSFQLIIEKYKPDTFKVLYYRQIYRGAPIDKYLCNGILDKDTLKVFYIMNDNGEIDEFYKYKRNSFLCGLYYRNDILQTIWSDLYQEENLNKSFILESSNIESNTNNSQTENNSNSKQAKNFPTVNVNSQVWMSKNLDVERYRNGDVIPQVQNMEEWSTLKYGAWCYLNNDPIYGEKYGKIYNNYAVNDSRGLAPEGFHIATTNEWLNLLKSLGNLTMAADKLKSKDTWRVNGSDIYGMEIKGGGFIARGGYSTLESYSVGFWTSTYKNEWISYNNREDWNDYIYINCGTPPIELNYGNGVKGFYVRCIKNN